MNWQSTYHNLIKNIIYCSDTRPSRNGITHSKFGEQITIQANEFPILESRQIFYKGVLGELAAMLRGTNKLADFKALGCNYWDAWADSEGKVDIDYGTAWRDFNGVDQLSELIDGLKTNPTGRRHIITGWRPDRLDKVALPCCHLLYQWYINNNGTLDMLWYQRSVDVMVGLPSDILFAVVWNMLVAQTVGYKPGKVTLILGDTHIYDNHMAGAAELVGRWSAGSPGTAKPVPKIELNPKATVFNFNPLDVIITDYNPGEPIKFKLNV